MSVAYLLNRAALHGFAPSLFRDLRGVFSAAFGFGGLPVGFGGVKPSNAEGGIRHTEPRPASSS